MTASNDRYPTKDAAYAAGVRDGLKHADDEQQRVSSALGDELFGGAPPPIRTLADVHALTASEVNENWDAVQAVLGGRS